MQFLLSVSVGPVQEMIAAARRTKDLWFGSTILSEVSKAAAAYLHSKNHRLIFPFSSRLERDLGPDSAFKVVNHVLAIAKTDSPAQLAEETKAAARQRFLQIAEATKRDISNKKLCQYNGTLFDGQIEEYLEFFSAWQEYGETVDYPSARKQLDSNLAARKALRNFSFHRGLAVEKSSLDGIRESVLPRPKDRPASLFISENEELDALGLVKRFGGKRRESRFDSTTDIAARPYVHFLKTKHRPLYSEYERLTKALEDQHVAPQSDAYLYAHESRQLKDVPNEAILSELQAVVERIRRTKSPQPPYYAILVGDGDSMGEALSEIKTPGAHQQFSELLSHFASDATQLVDQHHQGEAVFAGGDDVLAFLPLHTALSAAYRVRGAFLSRFEELSTKAPTFSAGLAIVHAMDSLSESLALARRAEKKAKRIHFGGAKDALCIIHSPRSGADLESIGHWDPYVGKLQEMIAAYNGGQLSRGYAYDLRTLLDKSKRLGLGDEVSSALPDLAKSMAERKQEKSDFLVSLIEEYCPPSNSSAEQRAALLRLSSDLMVAHPFARSTREASQS
jgi:CRISPR-associated protein Cmr2